MCPNILAKFAVFSFFNGIAATLFSVLAFAYVVRSKENTPTKENIHITESLFVELTEICKMCYFRVVTFI